DGPHLPAAQGPGVAAVLMREEGVVARDDNRGPLGRRHGTKRQAHPRARGGGASGDPSQARDRAPSRESQQAQRQIVTGGPFILRDGSPKKPVDTVCQQRTLCSLMRGVRRTVVVVIGVLACALRAVPASAQPQSGWDMALTGGFVASGLVDPVFALGNVTGQPARVVVREHDQESTVNLSVAMFGQIYN